MTLADDITVLAIVLVVDIGNVLVFVVTAVIVLAVLLITDADEVFRFITAIMVAAVDVSSINTIDSITITMNVSQSKFFSFEVIAGIKKASKILFLFNII